MVPKSYSQSATKGSEYWLSSTKAMGEEWIYQPKLKVTSDRKSNLKRKGKTLAHWLKNSGVNPDFKHGWTEGFNHSIFFFFKHLYWSITALQYCVSFCCITKWVSHMYTCIHISPYLLSLASPSLPPYPTPLGGHKATLQARLTRTEFSASAWIIFWACNSTSSSLLMAVF